jgi:hypothetical protein
MRLLGTEVFTFRDARIIELRLYTDFSAAIVSVQQFPGGSA